MARFNRFTLMCNWQELLVIEKLAKQTGLSRSAAIRDAIEVMATDRCIYDDIPETDYECGKELNKIRIAEGRHSLGSPNQWERT